MRGKKTVWFHPASKWTLDHKTLSGGTCNFSRKLFFSQTYTAIKIERYPYTGGGGTIIRANEVAIHLILLGRVDIGKLERLGIWASWGD